MEVEIQKFPRCIWHIGCPENSFGCGIIKLDGESVGDKTPIKCLHCGEKAVILRGTPFDARFCAEAP